MNHQKEKGVALILTLILLLLISVMGVSLMFVSQTETWSSLNYRLMSQARDAAEAGVNQTANYLMFTYAAPTVFTSYNASVYPVQNGAANASGHDAILSASTNVSSNYPDSAVQSAFNATGAGKGSLTASNTTVNYNTSAKLLRMQQVTPYGTVTPVTLQTWEITSDGTVSGVRSATEEVTAVLEQPAVPVFGYAVFANSAGCNALQFGGGGNTNSYDSNAALVGGVPVISTIDGNVGTNGNLSTNGNTTIINGSLSTPRTGVGTCSANNVTAWTGASGTVNGSIIELPQPIVYPTPVIPAPGVNDLSSSGNCPAALSAGCNKVGNNLHINSADANLIRDISLGGNKDMYIGPGTYNINSISESGSTALILETAATCTTLHASFPAAPCTPVDATHPVKLQVTGTGNATPVDLTGGSVVTSTTFKPEAFQILYAGTGTVKLRGGGTAAGLVYAPNGILTFNSNNVTWYGSVIAASMSDMGGATVSYDRALADKAFMVGTYVLNSFTWNKY